MGEAPRVALTPHPQVELMWSADPERELYRQLRADQQVVAQAAAELRRQAISDGYTGLEDKRVTFALALVLDELARHLRDLDEQLRVSVVDCCRALLAHH